MNYINIEPTDLVNGTGVRVTLYVSGCSHCCEGCFNEKSWDYRSGKEYTKSTESLIINYLEPNYITGLSLLGGDPLMRKNYNEVLGLCKIVKDKYPHKTIWCWTGYTLSELREMNKCEILEYIDVLIDGKFEIQNKDLTLAFRGSTNQNILKKGEHF